MKKHLVWGNIDMVLDDWREGIIECFPEINQDDEHEMWEAMYDLNNSYLDDERVNLDVELDDNILIIASLGLWHGHRTGYKEIGSNISDCLYTDCDYNEWYVDGYGNFRCTAVHHDGINHYLYRVWKRDTSDTQRELLMDKLYQGTATQRDITRYTRSVGKEISRIYGWR